MGQNGPAKEPSADADKAWGAFGYVLAGPVLYGGIGWLLDWWLDTAFLLPVGIVFGSILGMYLVIKTYAHRS